MIDAIAVIREGFRVKRLNLNTQVTTKEAGIKKAEIKKAAADYAAHVEELEAETKPLKLTVTAPNMEEKAKGSRSIKGLKATLGTALMEGKIAADAQAKDLRAKLAFCKENADGFGSLFRDLQQLAAKPMEEFKQIALDRVSAHKAELARIEAETAAAAQELADKLVAEAAEKARKEAETKTAQEAAQPIKQLAPSQPAAEVPKVAPEAAKQATNSLAAAQDAAPGFVSLKAQAVEDCSDFIARYKSIVELEWVRTEMEAFIAASNTRKAA